MAKRTAFLKQDFTSKYSSNEYSYPTDLVNSTEYGGNFVVFYINVQSQSKLRPSDQVVLGAQTGLNNNMGNISATTAAVVQGAKGAIAGGAVSAITGLFSSDSNAGSKSFGESMGAAGKALAAPVLGAVAKAGAVGLIAAESGGFSQPVKRLKTAIALYMPPQVSTTYGVNYSEAEMPMSFMGLQALSNAEGLGNTANTAASIGAALSLTGSSAADAMSKLSKLASNPTTEMIFKSVDTRTISFNYRFAPKSEKEAQNVLNIIQEFKFHMHPEFKDATSFLYIYPSEFDIVYYSGGTENDNIHRHTSCVLMNMVVNYSPNSVFSTFDNGMPTQIEITLSFKELAKLDKQKIMEGGY